MSVADSINAINDRKAALLNDPGRVLEGATLEGATLELDDWRPVLVGLDLDITEVEGVTTSCATHVVDWVAGGLDGFSALRALAFDMFVAGVYYERQRSRADESGGTAA